MEQTAPPELERRYRRFLEGRGDAVVPLVSYLRGEDGGRGATGAWAALVISRVMLLRGRPCLSGAWLRFSARRFARPPGGDVPLGLLVNHALVLRARGREEAAAKVLRRVFDLAVTAGCALAAAKAASNLAACLARRGDPSYRSFLAFASRSYEALGDGDGLRYTRMTAALGDGRSGRTDRALDRLHGLLGDVAGRPGERLGVLLLMAEIHLARDEHGPAAACLDDAASNKAALGLYRGRARRLRRLREALRDGDRIIPAGHLAGPAAAAGAGPSRTGRIRRGRGSAIPGPGLPVVADPSMRLLVDRLRRAARTPLPVLLTGETGVGKELLARLVHEQSGRAGEPFVPANMAAIPGDLFESVLFGHVRGAFTGAAGDAAGLAEAVGKGTLFLDEIGDLPPALQGKLLRFLDTGEYLPLGGRTARRSAGRIVAATNRDLGQLVAEGLFRADLYHRLDVFGFRVPPLRERRGDIVPIARWTLEEAAGRCDFGELELGEGARAVIERYDWPGNVRELRNELFRAATLAGGGTLRAGHFSERLLCGVFAAAEGSAGGLRERLEQAERREIAAALAAAAGNRSRAAALLGLKRTTLIYRIKRLGIGEG